MKLRFLIPFMVAAPLMAQTCTTATCTAANVSQSAVQAACPAPGNTHSSVTVNIPSGTGAWTGQIVCNQPALVTSLTFQGATTVTCTGTAGTSGYSCSATDNTIIQDAYAVNGPPIWIINSGASNTSLNVQGITFEGGSIGSPVNNKYGVISIGGSTSNFRFTGNHVLNSTYSPATISAWALVNKNVVGVMDHNLVDLSSGGSPFTQANGFLAFNEVGDTIGQGDGTWANPTDWGSLNWLFMESNYFIGGYSDDCTFAGKFVSRYNYFHNMQSAVQTHATKSSAGPERGCRAMEVYHNYIDSPAGMGDAPIGTKIGSALVWGNTEASGAYNNFFAAATDRNAVTTETNTPNGWGYCGTAFNGNGTGSCWDGNSGGAANACGSGFSGATTQGYPCLDGVGRGQTPQALNGAAFPPASPSRLNSSTGAINWPHQYLEPVYLWMNTVPSGNDVSIRDNVTQLNRDIYADCGIAGSGCSGSFNGTQGTGSGLHSARPATCTAGPGGSFATSPTGSYGVGWWSTDTNTFSVCTATNTWTDIYTPAVYPNPLVTGGGVSLTVSTGGSGTGNVTGPNSSSSTYTSGTPIGPLTANPTGGSTFVNWTVTGSASGFCAANPCTVFNITATTTVQANFNAASPVCGDPYENGPNYGGTYPVPPTILPLSVAWTSPTAGCNMLYTATTDGSTPATPTCGSTAYPGGGFSLGVAGNYKYRWIACQGGYTSSNVIGDQWLVTGGGTVIFSGTEGSNGNALNGSTPVRDAYTNCATSCLAGVPQPPNSGSVSHGQLWCNASQSTTCGGFSLSNVASTITGTGTHQLDNGLGAGGTDSLDTVTVSYGSATSGDCPVGTNYPSQLIPSILLPGAVANARAVFSGITDGTNFNTSLLAPTKWASVGTDNANGYIIYGCETVPTTSGTGFHLELDMNHTLSNHDYIGLGMHYNWTTSKWYYCPQGCSSFHAMNWNGGSAPAFTAGHHIYMEFYNHRILTCSSSSGVNCEFYDSACFKDYTAGTPIACGAWTDAATGLVPGGIPINQPSYPQEINLQHQLDYDSATYTGSVNSDFRGIVAYFYGAPGPPTAASVHITFTSGVTVK